MNTTMTGIFKIHYKYKNYWFTLPWCILLLNFSINWTLGYFFDEELYTGGLISIFIYIFIMGTILLHQTFPFAVGLSIRRTDYYWGTAATSVVVTVFSSILLMLLSIIESKFTEGWGVGLHYFNLPYMSEGSILEQMWISFVLLLFFFYLGFVTTSVHRRYGKIGILLLSVGVFLASSLGIFLMTYYKWWGSLFTALSDLSAFQLASCTFPVTLIFAGISYVLLRRSTV